VGSAHPGPPGRPPGAASRSPALTVPRRQGRTSGRAHVLCCQLIEGGTWRHWAGPCGCGHHAGGFGPSPLVVGWRDGGSEGGSDGRQSALHKCCYRFGDRMLSRRRPGPSRGKYLRYFASYWSMHRLVRMAGRLSLWRRRNSAQMATPHDHRCGASIQGHGPRAAG
jgi:hypothetical protein